MMVLSPLSATPPFSGWMRSMLRIVPWSPCRCHPTRPRIPCTVQACTCQHGACPATSGGPGTRVRGPPGHVSCGLLRALLQFRRGLLVAQAATDDLPTPLTRDEGQRRVDVGHAPGCQGVGG